jgi:hypothetical protein
MLSSVNATNYDGVKEILDKADNLKISLDTAGVTINVGGQDKELGEGIDTFEFDSSLDSSQTVELIAKFKLLFVGEQNAGI